MAKIDINEYIASQSPAVQGVLEQVRSAIRKALPKAEESISYNIPTYKLEGRAVLYFAAWKQHYSIYPASAELIAAFQEELAAYKVQKSTIRFPLSQAVPVKLIAGIAKFRVKEIGERQQA
jgi:uncharacterized protein YdhG (YjbR/CyaY superfamily)